MRKRKPVDANGHAFLRANHSIRRGYVSANLFAAYFLFSFHILFHSHVNV